MNENILLRNYVNYIASAMKENGCPNDIRTSEDVLSNLYYLSKDDNRGSRYIPLQYKRIVEKLVLGAFNSAFIYEDKKDVYFENVKGQLVCCANVYWVKINQDGSTTQLGHGFHALTLDNVMPGIFMSDAERIAKWKQTVIGGAKSRALYDGGIGLEFYGDIFAPYENVDEYEVKSIDTAQVDNTQKTDETDMPIPKPKRGRPRKINENVTSMSIPLSEGEGDGLPLITLADAKKITCDIGHYKGMSLGSVYAAEPRNLITVVGSSIDPMVIMAAKVIIHSDEDLLSKYENR